MTQRTLKTAIGGQAATVLMGWDKPLQYPFMVIEYLNGDEEPLHSNLDDGEAALAALPFCEESPHVWHRAAACDAGEAAGR